MGDIDIQVPSGVTQHCDTIEADVEEFLNDVFNNLAQLRTTTLDEVSKKKGKYSSRIDLIINQVEKFTQLKTTLRSEAESYLQTLYPKWLRSLGNVLSSVRQKVDDILEDSTLCTKDFTDGPYSEDHSGLRQNRAPTRLYPNIEEHFNHSNLSPTKRKRFGTSSPPEKKRKNTRSGFAATGSQESSNRTVSGRSTGFTTPVETETDEECSSEEASPERNAHSTTKVMENKTDELNQLVWEWFSKEESKYVSIIGRMIQTKAREIAKDIGHTNFNSSFAWLESFKTQYHISWNPVGPSGTPTLESEKMREESEEDDEQIEEEEEEEEEVPMPVPSRRGRLSTRKSTGSILKASTPSPPSKRTRKSMAPEPTDAPSPPSKRTRKSMAKLPEPTDETPVVRPGRKNGSQVSSPASKAGRKYDKLFEAVRSFWKPIMSIDSKEMLEQPAIYQIKVHQAKKPAYIGVCDNLRSQVLKCQKAESKQKQLDKFLDRNRDDIEVMFFYCDSLASAKEQHKEEIGKFKAQHKRNPVFNV